MKFFEICIIMLIINSSFQDDCTFEDGACKKAEGATFEDNEKICVLNTAKNGCNLRNVECKDFNSLVYCTGAKLNKKHKMCNFDSDRNPNCYEDNEYCSLVQEKNDCNGYSPDVLTKCVWDEDGGVCLETKCEETDKDNCGSYIPVDSSKQCTLDSTTDECKEVSKPNNKALYLKFSLMLFISLILLSYDII